MELQSTLYCYLVYGCTALDDFLCVIDEVHGLNKKIKRGRKREAMHAGFSKSISGE
jgi:hypothetical protein